MALCATLEEIVFGCERNSGGLFELYLGDVEDVDSKTEVEADWEITAMTVDTAPVKISIKRGTSNYTEEEAEDLVNGSTVNTVTVNLMLHRRSAEKSRALSLLSAGQRYLYGLLKDANGVWWYADHLQVTTKGEGSGQARADGSKYSVVLVAEMEHQMYVVDEAVALAVIATAS
jgi:hypothetical protein